MSLRVPANSPGHWAIRGLWVVATLAFLLYIPTKAQTSTINDMTFAFELALAAMALNLVMGFGGIISLGHSAFFGLGAYTTAVLVDKYGWSQGWTIPVAAVLTFVVGALVSMPALRLRGIYLALVTLGLAVLFPSLIRWKKAEWLTAGARGISGLSYKDVPSLPLVGDDSPREARAVFMYWLAVLAAVVGYLVCRGIVKSRVGRSLVAIRDNETAAAVMGIDSPRTKTLVFGVSAALCAVGGSLFAIRTNVANVVDIPYFTLIGSIIFVIVMVLGGAATLWGPIVGAIVYVGLDTRARRWGEQEGGVVDAVFGWMAGSPANLILAVVLLAMMFIAPFGIVGLLKRLAAKVLVVVPAPAGTGSRVTPTTGGDPAAGAPPAPSDSITTRGDT